MVVNPIKKVVSYFSKEKEFQGNGGCGGCYIDTAIKLCCGERLTCSEFVRIQKYNFFNKIINDIYTRLSGVDDELSNLLIDNSDNLYSVSGLLQFLTDGLVNRSNQKIKLVDYNEFIKSKYNQSSSNCPEEYRLYDEDKNRKILTRDYYKEDIVQQVICINYNENYLSKLLDILFSIQFSIIYGMNTGASVSNALIIKKYGLNTANPNLRDAILTDMSSVKEALQSFGKSVGIMDSEDKLELVQPIKGVYSEYQQGIDSMIASATGFPISYINGVLSGSLNTTGEGDKIQLDNALKSFYEANISNHIELLCIYIRYDFNKVNFLNDIVGRFTDFAQYIPNLESTSLLPEKRKREIMYHALGYSEETLKEDEAEIDKENQEKEMDRLDELAALKELNNEEISITDKVA